jgi:hypothetical protein
MFFKWGDDIQMTCFCFWVVVMQPILVACYNAVEKITTLALAASDC